MSTSKKIAIPGGQVGCSYNGTVASWTYEIPGSSRGGTIHVPAIREVRVAMVHQGMVWYRHPDFSPETIAMRRDHYARRGFTSESHSFQQPPVVGGYFNLLGHALDAARSLIPGESVDVRGEDPNVIHLRPQSESSRNHFGSICLYFNHSAFEFYHLLFKLNTKERDSVCFEAPDVDISTMAKLAAWAKTFDSMKRRQYTENGWAWDPYPKGWVFGGVPVMSAPDWNRGIPSPSGWEESHDPAVGETK